MADKIIDIIRRAIAAKNERQDVTFGYGLERHSFKTRGLNRFGDEDKYHRYWITSFPIDAKHMYEGDDIILYRNAPIATRMQECGVNDEFDMRILGKGNDAGCYHHHHCHVLHTLDFDNNSLEHVTEGKLLFDTLEKYLQYLEGVACELAQRDLRCKEIEEEKKRAQTDAERKALEQELRKIEKERKKLQEYKEEINNLTRYIHTQVQLRFRPIVDPIQTKIKTSHLYDGTAVIIDGGPGTGKTTTMISRLKYLTDKIAILQDAEQELGMFQLNAEKRRTLFELIEEDKDWVFFSPSELLKQYLEHAMVNERLSKPTSKVFYWSERLDKLMKDYGFFDPSSDNPPFINAKSSQQTQQLIANTGSAIKQLEDFYVSKFKNIRTNLPSLEHISADTDWKIYALSIRKLMEGIENKSLNELIDLFVQLSRRAEECKPFLDERTEKLGRVTNYIEAKIRLNAEARQALLDIILKNNEPEPEDTDEPDVDVEEEQEVEEIDTYGENERIRRYIRKWVEPYARSIYGSHKLSELQQAVAEIIVPLLSDGDNNALERIASLKVFSQYAAYTKGVAKIMFASIPTKYKSFRKSILKEQQAEWNLDLLRELVETKNNTRLHKQEQALLIGFVNTLAVKLLRKNSTAQHRYIDCYKSNSRPIIGIDEATDFSDVDIYAMCSFAHKDFSAITLSGDLMQRLTDTGLHKWEELQSVLPNYEIMPLQTSYRQSTKMLEVARQLYRDTIGENPTYKAHMREQKVPEAIAYISESTGSKIEWIEKRIREIYTAYGNTLPSIAIFLNDAERVAIFAKRLKETDFFEDNGIPVIDGSQGTTLGNSDQVRVFPIDKVKGMEFDVVFFIDIDDTERDEDMVKRLLYVGVSRAAFFLGVTLSEDDPKFTKYFQVGANWRAITQQNA